MPIRIQNIHKQEMFNFVLERHNITLNNRIYISVDEIDIVTTEVHDNSITVWPM